MAVFITLRDMLGAAFGVALFSLANSLGEPTETSDGPYRYFSRALDAGFLLGSSASNDHKKQ